MKFEEILPKMRDEGRVGLVGTTFFKISLDGKLWMKLDTGYWEVIHNLNEEYLITDEWSIVPRKVKKWQWVFGVENRANFLMQARMTKQEACDYAKEHNFHWTVYIDQTMIEEEE